MEDDIIGVVGPAGDSVHDDSEVDLCCWVCNNPVGGAHVICGKAAGSDEEEGYGQKVNCFRCLNGQDGVPPEQVTSGKSDIWAAFKRSADPSSGDKQPIPKRSRKAVKPDSSSEMDPHVCLDCGSEISRGQDYNKKRHWMQKHSDRPNEKYAKYIVPKNHELARKLLNSKDKQKSKEGMQKEDRT